MWTDPSELLGKHQYLLEEDFAQLGEGSAGGRQHWFASVESALAAADHVPARNFGGILVHLRLRGIPGPMLLRGKPLVAEMN